MKNSCYICLDWQREKHKYYVTFVNIKESTGSSKPPCGNPMLNGYSLVYGSWCQGSGLECRIE